MDATALSGLAYELLTQVVKNTNITINLNAKQPVTDVIETISETSMDVDAKPSTSAETPESETGPSEPTGLVRTDLVRLIDDLERVSTTLKMINKSVVGNEYTDVFFMLQNFDTILNSVKMVVNAV